MCEVFMYLKPSSPNIFSFWNDIDNDEVPGTLFTLAIFFTMLTLAMTRYHSDIKEKGPFYPFFSKTNRGVRGDCGVEGEERWGQRKPFFLVSSKTKKKKTGGGNIEQMRKNRVWYSTHSVPGNKNTERGLLWRQLSFIGRRNPSMKKKLLKGWDNQRRCKETDHPWPQIQEVIGKRRKKRKQGRNTEMGP